MVTDAIFNTPRAGQFEYMHGYASFHIYNLKILSYVNDLNGNLSNREC